jgi:hypothetical protein
MNEAVNLRRRIIVIELDPPEEAAMNARHRVRIEEEVERGGTRMTDCVPEEGERKARGTSRVQRRSASTATRGGRRR